MRDVVVIEYVSLDGVIQGPGHDGEDSADGFTEGGWSRPFLPDHRRYATDLYHRAGAFLFGRLTYDIWLEYWPTVTDPDDLIAAALNKQPKYVASDTLDRATWDGTTIVRRTELRLVDATITTSGLAILTYEPPAAAIR